MKKGSRYIYIDRIGPDAIPKNLSVKRMGDNAREWLEKRGLNGASIWKRRRDNRLKNQNNVG
jgi:hypothetical protein